MRRPSRARTAILALATTLVAAACGTAYAYFSTTGVGSVAAGVTSLPKPTISSATPAVGGTVTVTWGAVTAPSTGTVTYYVTRDGGEAAGTCASIAAPTTATSCVDKNVEPGNHSFVVTALWRSWSSGSLPASAKVIVGAATHFALSAASTTPIAGATDNLTITAQDSANSTVTSYAGSHNLTFAGASASPGGTLPTVVNSSGTAVNFGTATAITFTAGIASVASSKNGVLKLYRAESATISVTEGTLTGGSGLSLTVSNGALSKFVLGVETTTPAAGAEDDLTVTAQDAYGNVVTSYAGSHELTFSGASASPAGNLPTVTNSSGAAVAFGIATPIVFSSGVATENEGLNGEMRLYKTGATSVKVTEGAITNTAVVVTVAPGPATKFAMSASTLTPLAGASVNLTTTAQDLYGNTASGYTGSHELTFTGAAASPGGTLPTVANSAGTAVNLGTATAITFTAGVATVSSTKNGVMKLYRAEPTTVSVTDGTLANGAGLALTVSPAALSKFILGVETTTPAVGAEDDLTITAQDTYANVITSFTGSHNLIFSGAVASPSGTLPTVTNSSGAAVAFGTATPIVFSSGVATENEGLNGEMRLYKSAAASIKVAEGSIASATVTVTATAGPAAKFLLAASTLVPAAAGTITLTTTAQDAYGNTAVSYVGSHSLTFSGAGASMTGTLPTVVDSAGAVVNFGSPTAITFTAGVATSVSSKNGLMRLYRAEPTTVVVSDGSISNGAGLTFTVSATTAAKLIFTNTTSSAGEIAAGCGPTCTVSNLGNSGTISANVAVADTYGNRVSTLGTGHSVAVTTTGGAVTGGSLTFPSTGVAESATQFTFTAQSSGAFTDTIKATTSAGTVYTVATMTATR